MLIYLFCFSDKFTEKNAEDLKKKSSKISVVTLNDLEKLGKSSKRLDSYERPKKDDLAMIMYTSGSTGQPKGYYLLINILTQNISINNF